ncbi:MAG: hypothetical protein F6K36_29440, partial [Symploca sp. SIO3C6]|nr:hypothetical protein [Symploca sp. SIO3C6]
YQTWEVVIKDWGGYNNDRSRNTPYDGDGNGAELYVDARIRVDGVLSTWQWNGCPSDCYNDESHVNAPDGWNNARELLRSRRIFRGKARSRPVFEIDLIIFENDDEWPAWTGIQSHHSNWEQAGNIIEQTAEVGESIAIISGPSAPYVQGGFSAVREIMDLISNRSNADDALWSFSRVLEGATEETVHYAVPGHQSTHWITIKTQIVR